MANPRYDDREAMAPPQDHRWTLLLEQIPPRARVLEIGCGRGYGAVAMASKGCSVVGIELDAEAAAEARERCERVLVGDALDLLASPDLTDASFDVIVAADVIEHLVDPIAVLRRCRRLLAEGGFILASIPNATHASVILTMCEGRFPWLDEGLFDRTHLHQFGEDSALGLFAEAGYGAAIVARRHLDPRNTELRSSLDVPDEVLRFLDRNPNADTYQFILRADCTLPIAAAPAPSARPHQTLRSALVAEVDELRADMRRYHEAALVREKESGELRADVLRYHEAALAREEELGRCHETIASREAEVRRGEAARAVQDRLLAERARESISLRLRDAVAWIPEYGAPAVDARGAAPRTLFVAADGDAPTRYRCVYAAEQLRRDGAWAAVRRIDDPGLHDVVRYASVVVLFRQPWSDAVARLVDHARACGARIVLDTDDLVFDPELIDCLTFLDRMPPEDRRIYTDLLPAVRQTFDEADHVIAATVTLAARARFLGKPATVHPNLVSPGDERRARLLRGLRRLPRTTVWVGYASGSHTHDEDFAFVAPALARILERRHDVRILLCGFVNLPRELAPFADRMTRLPYLDHEVYAWALSRCRVVLSPAAETNLFTDSKSPMKLLEAGLLEVPTIATPTHSYGELITSGWNGWLASSERDWIACLGEALDPERAAEVGRCARRTVEGRLTYAAQAGRLGQLLAQIDGRAPPSEPAPRSLGSTAILSPRPGVRTVARRWRQRWFLFRRGDVGRETLRVAVTDWWREQQTSLLEPRAFTGFLERSDRRWEIDGWKSAGNVRQTYPGSFESVDADPQLISTSLDIDPTSRRFLVVRQRTRTESPRPSAQLFFAASGSGFSEEASARFPLAGDGRWQTYVLDLAGTRWPLGGRITSLRYDPLDAPGVIDLELVALLPETPELLSIASAAFRKRLADRHLRGRGVEIGDLRNRLALPDGARAFFVDQPEDEHARLNGPELGAPPLPGRDLVCDVASLPLRSGCLDFAVANRTLARAKDSFGALAELLRVVRPGGVIFTSVRSVVGRPDDPSANPIPRPAADREEIGPPVERRRIERRPIDHHTFDEQSFRELLDGAAGGIGVDVEVLARNRVDGGEELVAILRRRRQPRRAAS